MAQLGARLNGIQEAAGSIPASSTKFFLLRGWNPRHTKGVSGGKESVPLSNYSHEVAKRRSELLNEVKMRVLRGNCQKFPLKERSIERPAGFDPR